MKGYDSALFADRLQLQHRRLAQQVFDPLTSTARTVPANALSSIRETRIFQYPHKYPSQSTIEHFLEAVQTDCHRELGIAVRRDLAKWMFRRTGGQ
jgi:hypothetical protein